MNNATPEDIDILFVVNSENYLTIKSLMELSEVSLSRYKVLILVDKQVKIPFRKIPENVDFITEESVNSEIMKYKPNYVNVINQDTGLSELYMSTISYYSEYN
ncbi:hypothetical protein [Candidatus Mancarchaeum acidiphilum]|uniref:hypothetical protein n=1 Tax=Candidatus Mancarchaeum acidiphilum TaxID=1920749 RepID=UPI000B58DF50|nr:hypothetical protein [Candidatus Mancarchaeum acidiphilum]